MKRFALLGLALAVLVAMPLEAGAQAVRPGTNPNRYASTAQSNQVIVVQEGNANAAGVVQRGAAQTAVIGQFGNANAACIVTWGQGTSAGIVQQGDGQAALVFRTPTRQRVFQGAEAEARMRRACGL
jgi:hypothetical protein